jgi:arylsulfatase A
LVQLYDMTADVGERHNVQAAHPEIVKSLTVLLEQYVAAGRSTPGANEKNETTVDIWKQQDNGQAGNLSPMDS